MRFVLRLTAALVAITVLSGCEVNNSSNIDFDTRNISYTKDARTGLCFAYTASRKTGDWNATGLGMTRVECTEEVLRLID